MKANQKTLNLALLVIGLLPLAGCVSKRGEMGVQNLWRDSALPAFEKGRSTQSDVMRALGPPSQVIALHDQTLFYYLCEQDRTKGLFLLFYNHLRQRITYDRAIFFFNRQQVLTDLAYSAESIPREK